MCGGESDVNIGRAAPAAPSYEKFNPSKEHAGINHWPAAKWGAQLAGCSAASHNTLPGEMQPINHDAVPPELINSLGERQNLSSAWREYILTWIQRPTAF
jgi:hypothetical protein